jgi:hypothetical protein
MYTVQQREQLQVEQPHFSLSRHNEIRNEKSAYAGGVVLSQSDSGHNQ